MKSGGILIGLLTAASVLVPAAALAQTSETSVKAAFLPRFARYVTWPPQAVPGPSEPFNLCLIGGDPFGETLDSAIRSQSIDGRRVTLRRLSSASGADRCHIAFIQGSRSQPAGQILAALAGKPVLTVTDARHGSQRGMIHFAVVGGRVRFSIDEATAASRGLAISSRLLTLAVGVRQR